jgi:hypothetical protein
MHWNRDGTLSRLRQLMECGDTSPDATSHGDAMSGNSVPIQSLTWVPGPDDLRAKIDAARTLCDALYWTAYRFIPCDVGVFPRPELAMPEGSSPAEQIREALFQYLTVEDQRRLHGNRSRPAIFRSRKSRILHQPPKCSRTHLMAWHLSKCNSQSWRRSQRRCPTPCVNGRWS